MSTRPRAPAAVTSPPGFPLRRATIALALLAMAVSLVSSGAVRAEPPPKVTQLERKDPADPPVAIPPDVVHVNGQALVTVELPSTARDAHGRPAARLLAATPDGSRIAVTHATGGPDDAAITIRQPDGSVVVRELPGVITADFSRDGTTLAVLDGHGHLYRLDSDSGEGEAALEGPFSGSLLFEDSGTLLALAVSSVEAPYQSSLVRIDLTSGSMTPLSGGELVFSATVLEDGSVAYVARRPGGVPTVSRISPDGSVSQLAELEIAAINVAVSPDARRFAYEVAGNGAFVVDSPESAPRPLGAGRSPVFSPDGSEVLLNRENASVVVGLDGGVLEELPDAGAVWLECVDEECAP